MINAPLSWLLRRFQAGAQLAIRLISDPHVYVELLNQPWPKTVGLFLVATGLVGAINGFQMVHRWGAQLLQIPQAVSDEWVANYPAKLVIKWQNATLTTQPAATQPVTIPWPAGLVQLDWGGPLAVYDPRPDTKPTELAKTLPQKPLIILNQHQLWINSSDDQWTQNLLLTDLPLLAQGDQTWDKPAVVNLLGQAVSQIRHWLQTGLLLWPAVSILLTWISKTWFVLTEGTFLWALGRIIGWKLSWRKLIKLTSLLVPVAVLVEWLGQQLYPQLGWSLFHPTFWILLTYLSFQFPRPLLNLPPKLPKQV